MEKKHRIAVSIRYGMDFSVARGVNPEKTEVQLVEIVLDSRFRGNDDAIAKTPS